MKTVLYIHGMGGGEDSRIPAILSLYMPQVHIAIRTYDFDPDIAGRQIRAWVEELHPDLLVGESLGAVHALCVPDLPLLLVSPALGASRFLCAASSPCRMRAVRAYFERKFGRRQERRQDVRFDPVILKKWPLYRQMATKTPHLSVYAFFGKKDHYRRSGVVSICDYRKYFGDSYSLYDGSHYMEEEYVLGMLVPAIEKLLT